MEKLCIHILQKNIAKRNVIKENHHSNKFLNYFLVGFLENFLIEFCQVYEKLYPQHGTQFFYYLKEPNIFVERMYQLNNFDKISNVVI